MGKSCLRFKRLDQLLEEAIAVEIGSANPTEFIAMTEEARAKGGC